jgi:hypothetical protein
MSRVTMRSIRIPRLPLTSTTHPAPSRPANPADLAPGAGLTLIHLSAQHKHILRDTLGSISDKTG